MTWPDAARAGANAGGTLIVHANPNLIYTTSYETYCGESDLSDPSLTNVSVPADSGVTRVFHVLAAFPDASGPRLKGIGFGIAYDAEHLALLAVGGCGDFEISDTGWPESGTGTSLTWTSTQTTQLTEVYWFAGYGYAPGPHVFAVTPHPLLGGTFVDDSEPRQSDPIADYGYLGFGTFGYRPGTEAISADAHEVSVYVAPGSITFDDLSHDALPPDGVAFSCASLRDTLFAHGATAVRKSFPGRTPADTIATSRFGDLVRLPALSPYFRISFPSRDAAIQAAAAVLGCGCVSHAELVPDSSIAFTEPVNDSLFGDIPGYPDGQWYLKNDGQRQGYGNCGDAIQDMDIRIDTVPYWYNSMGNLWNGVGIVDSGVWAYQNEPYNDFATGWQCGPYHEWEIDFCGSHGTKMAGIAAAWTDNDGRGIAGVCPQCAVIDIACIRVPPPNPADCLSHDLMGSGAPEYIVDAVYACHDDPGWFRLASLEIARGGLGLFELTDALLTAYRLNGTVTSIAVGNREIDGGAADYPGAFPFVLGVGGFTWTGEFYNRQTNCLDGEGAKFGPMSIDISGPASGWAWGINHPDAPFAPTNMATSGASAAVAGTIALLRSYWMDEIGEETTPPPDYIAGFITGSALDYTRDPTTYEGQACPECPRDYYGPGRLNVAGALRLLEIFHNPTSTAWFQQRTLAYADCDSVVVSTDRFSVGDTLITSDTIYWTVTAGSVSEPYLPGHVAFLLPELSRVYPHVTRGELHITQFWVDDTNRASIMAYCPRRGVSGGHMGVFDVQGHARVWGDYYRYSVDGGQTWADYGWSRETMYVNCLVLMTEGDGVPPVPAGSFDVHFASPAVLPIRFGFAGATEEGTRLQVFDVSGRRVVELWSSRGEGISLWSGERTGGGRVAPGVYFVRAASGGRVVVKRLIVTR